MLKTIVAQYDINHPSTTYPVLLHLISMVVSLELIILLAALVALTGLWSC